MNKAFVREPEFDGKAYCPHCGALGRPVNKGVLDHHLKQEVRSRMGDAAWFCEFAGCEVAYFDQFERLVVARELRSAVYPKEASAPICACFGFTLEEIEADVQDGTPTRIRALLAKSQSSEARCHTIAANGQCCLQEVQRLYIRQTTGPSE